MSAQVRLHGHTYHAVAHHTIPRSVRWSASMRWQGQYVLREFGGGFGRDLGDAGDRWLRQRDEWTDEWTYYELEVDA